MNSGKVGRHTYWHREWFLDPALVFDYMNPCKNNVTFDDKVLQVCCILIIRSMLTLAEALDSEHG